MPFILTDQGLTISTPEEVQAELLARLQAEFGVTLNTSLQSISGQWARIVGEVLAGYQQQVSALYQSIDPNSAVGVLLDQRAALTGTIRRGETHSTVEGVLVATGAVVVPAGTTVRNDIYQTFWETATEVIFGGAGAEAVVVRAVDPGPSVSFANDPWTITTPLVNLFSFATPVEDATVGRLIEGDPAFRLRRTGELFKRGQGPLLAISGAALELAGVRWARAFHNPSENPVGTDPDRNLGIPYKEFELVVQFDESSPPPELITEIAYTIWGQQGAGVNSYGVDYSEVIIDSEGQGQLVRFSEVQEVDVYLKIVLLTSNQDEPIIPLSQLEMANLVRTKSVERATLISAPGRDFKSLDYIGVITRLIADGELSGIIAAECFVSFVSAVAAVDQNLTINIRQQADLDHGEVVVYIDGNEFNP